MRLRFIVASSAIASIFILQNLAVAYQENGNSSSGGSDGICGSDHIFARYAKLITELIEENFYVNDTYTCSYVYYVPGDTVFGSGITTYHYRCVPNVQTFGPGKQNTQNNSAATSEGSAATNKGGAAAGTTYFEAVLTPQESFQPTLNVQIIPYVYEKPFTTSYEGDEIPQPELTNSATLVPTIQWE